MRQSMILALALAALSCAAQARHAATKYSLAPEQRSAILIILDDVGAADLALYGGPVETPNLAALAERGVLFDRAYVNATCAVTRRSLLFGHWTLRGGGVPCSSAPPSLTLDDWCLPRLLTQRSILAGKWHLGSDPLGGTDLTAPLTHGFEHWTAGAQANLNDCGGLNYTNWRRVEDGVVVASHAYEPEYLTSRIQFWWDAIGSAKLFVVAPALAHGPMHSPDGITGLTKREQYEAMILRLDQLVGDILTAVADDVLVVVVGDNGTPINVSPDPERSKTTTFERGIRVPLIIAGGAVASPGRVSEELVHAVDVYRTILDWCGGSLPQSPAHPIVGCSLLPTLEHAAPHAYHDYVLCGDAWGNAGGDRAAVSLEWKLRQLDDDGDDVPDREELYDLVADPEELTNVLSEYPGQAEAMRAWIESVAP